MFTNVDYVNTLANGFKAELDTKQSKKDAVQPDWNQNDEKAADYVKNRPFYTTDSALLLKEISLDFSNGVTISNPFTLSDFVEGQTYKIIWDNVPYICVAYGAGRPSAPSVGNASIYGVFDNGNSKNEPFFIRTSNGNVEVSTREINCTHTVSIYSLSQGVVKLPSEYHQNSNIIDGEGIVSVKTIGATEASGKYSFAEGKETIASGWYSHAAGYNTVASSDFAHAEGSYTTASGQGSHAEGYYTVASSTNQHVQGEYNIEDSNNMYAHIVGNGYSGSKSNAHTLDWNGNAWFQGDVYVGSNSGTNKDEGSVKLQREINGIEGQVVGFDANGNAVAVDAIVNTSITIPAGRLVGDINGDGVIDSTDFNLLVGGTGSAGIKYFNANFENDFISKGLEVPIDYLAADTSTSGDINMLDMNALLDINAFYPTSYDLLNNWSKVEGATSNTEYPFYVDIQSEYADNHHDFIIIADNACPYISSQAQIVSGAIRIFAKWLPVNDVNANVTISNGNGNASIVIAPNAVTETINTSISNIDTGSVFTQLVKPANVPESCVIDIEDMFFQANGYTYLLYLIDEASENTYKKYVSKTTLASNKLTINFSDIPDSNIKMHFTRINVGSGTSRIVPVYTTQDANNTFIAEYNVTTFAEIKTAYNEGKQCMLKYDMTGTGLAYWYYPLRLFSENPGFIGFCGSQGNVAYTFYVQSSGWDMSSFEMPNVPVTTDDNGKFMRVVDGAWAAVAVPSAEEASF